MPPKFLTDVKKVDVLMGCDRTAIDFKREIRSMFVHEQTFERRRLATLVNSVYIPKLKAKSFSAYLYSGETPANYNSYARVEPVEDAVFKAGRSRDDLILGIESSFDESAAALINSYGEVKANEQITQWEQWQDNDGIIPDVSMRNHMVNLPKATEKVLKEMNIKKGDPRLKAIAVTLGPGLEHSLNVGIKFAQELGRELEVPVIPVNHIEGHVLTCRFNQSNKQGGDVPLQKFPYLSLLVTGKHTEIVLTRGVGLHTILGMTIDIAAGDCLDKAQLCFKRYESVLRDSAAQHEFIERYNAKVKRENKGTPIPKDYFEKLFSDQKMSKGRFIELLARYGDPTELELPLGLKNDQNADMSFTGLKTAIQSAVSCISNLSVPRDSGGQGDSLLRARAKKPHL